MTHDELGRTGLSATGDKHVLLFTSPEPLVHEGAGAPTKSTVLTERGIPSAESVAMFTPTKQ